MEDKDIKKEKGSEEERVVNRKHKRDDSNSRLSQKRGTTRHRKCGKEGKYRTVLVNEHGVPRGTRTSRERSSTRNSRPVSAVRSPQENKQSNIEANSMIEELYNQGSWRFRGTSGRRVSANSPESEVEAEAMTKELYNKGSWRFRGTSGDVPRSRSQDNRFIKSRRGDSPKHVEASKRQEKREEEDTRRNICIHREKASRKRAKDKTKK